MGLRESVPPHLSSPKNAERTSEDMAQVQTALSKSDRVRDPGGVLSAAESLSSR